MSRAMIIGGVFLILLAVAVLVFGLSDPQDGFFGQLVQTIVCQNGETIVVEERYRYFEGGVSLEFYCQLEPQLRRDVTAQATIMLMIAFLIPFLSGIGLMIWAAAKWQNQMISHLQKTRSLHASRFQPVQNDPPSTDTILAEKLRQLDVAYEQGLISNEEYQTSRQKILDKWSQ